ncbi:hypothetical protein TNCV_79791 [Trichonephila clavipes]|nr:hypothetical protein TNCV_79791 [Trichonephila clavipes]
MGRDRWESLKQKQHPIYWRESKLSTAVKSKYLRNKQVRHRALYLKSSVNPELGLKTVVVFLELLGVCASKQKYHPYSL